MSQIKIFNHQYLIIQMLQLKFREEMNQLNGFKQQIDGYWDKTYTNSRDTFASSYLHFHV